MSKAFTKKVYFLLNTMYIYIYIYINLPVNAIVRLRHPRSGDSQGQETFLAPSVDKQTLNYDTECSNHHPSLSNLRSRGLSRSKMKWWAIYINLPINTNIYIVNSCSWVDDIWHIQFENLTEPYETIYHVHKWRTKFVITGAAHCFNYFV